MEEITIPKALWEEGISVLEVATLCGAAKSKSEARTLIKQGGLSIIVGPFGKKVSDPNAVLTGGQLPRYLQLTVEGVERTVWVVPDGWEEMG